MSVTELQRSLSSSAISAKELLDVRRRKIGNLNGKLNAFITVFTEASGLRSTRRAPLRGITIAVKDNICVKGHRTTAGSRVLERFVPTTDADAVARLKGAGAVLMGKTNLHEFAFGVTNINPFFGDCRNPWNSERISGGSSGGSAVAVASGMSCAAVGTDTAGSVRIPASLCGVVGYKPSYGLISRRGIVPLSWSFDTVGFLTRGVEDATLLASIVCDSKGTLGRPRPIRLRGLRIGVPTNMLQDVDEDVRLSYERALNTAEDAGAKLVRFDFPHVKETIACRSLITHAEAASYHRRHFFRKYLQYGAELRKRLAQGLAIPAAVYLDAQRARGPLIESYVSVFEILDLIASPTTPIAAPTIRDSKNGETSKKIRATLLTFTEPFNVYGAPAISIPCGLTREMLPVGLQLAGNLNSDNLLLSAALSLERLLPNNLRRIPTGD